MTRVSVVIPLYNKAPHIRRTIDSVLGQTFSDFELIIVDDGSTDGGPELVRDYSDTRVKLIHQVNAGKSAARNKGIACAESELVAFLDADDEWQADFLESVMSMRAHFPQAGLYGTNFLICENGRMRKNGGSPNVTGQGEALMEDYFERIATGPMPFWTSSVMIPKAILDEVGGFAVGVKTGEDLRTWIQIALQYPIACSSRECAIYHLDAVNRVSGSENKDDVAWADLIEQGRLEELKPSEQVYCREFLCKMRLSLARSHVMAGRRSQARRLLAKTAGTNIFRATRRRLLVLSLFPHIVLRLWLWAKNNLRGAGSQTEKTDGC